MDEEKLAFAKPFEADVSRKAGVWDITLMIFINFLSFVCFAIVLPSLSPFVEAVYGHDNSTFQLWLGAAVALNSFGTFVGSPIMGKWADKRGVKEVILFSLVVMIFGNILYSMSPNVYVLCAARFIVGFSAANYAPASAYLAYATSIERRTLVMTLNSAASILGFAAGPSLATPFLFSFKIWKFDFYRLTWPGYISAVLAVVGLLLTLVLFHDIEVPVLDPVAVGAAQKSDLAINAESVSEEEYEDVDPLGGSVKNVTQASHASLNLSKAASQSALSLGELATGKRRITVVHGLLLFLQFAFYCAFTVFETLGTLYAQHSYGWSTVDAGYLFSAIGADCVVALVILQIFVSVLRVPDMITLLISQVIMIAGFGVLVNYPFQDPVQIWRFLVGVFSASGAFSAACALLISVFSKVSDGLEQGFLMGLLSSSGSVARIVGPLAATFGNKFVGPGAVFAGVVGVLMASVVATVVVIFMQCMNDSREEDKKREKRGAIERRKPRRVVKRKERSGLSRGKRVHATLDPAKLQAQSVEEEYAQ
eukprot:TRINITY_DN2547_c0_g3_i1.p1 TRINITY_DN2547_c0_g3~~TRINITY_DN2547_c0_g3_i1.p1  ORF type:complete len:537 (-),score=95.03 TRINITY_DN2547_c0_g3_i1:119-1729(-)